MFSAVCSTGKGVLTLISVPLRVRGGSVSARDAGADYSGFRAGFRVGERFHNSLAPAGDEQGAFFLMKKALCGSGCEGRQL